VETNINRWSLSLKSFFRIDTMIYDWIKIYHITHNYYIDLLKYLSFLDYYYYYYYLYIYNSTVGTCVCKRTPPKQLDRFWWNFLCLFEWVPGWLRFTNGPCRSNPVKCSNKDFEIYGFEDFVYNWLLLVTAYWF